MEGDNNQEGENHEGQDGGVSVKTLKRMLKKKGLKTTGKKSTLTRRARKAGLKGGQLSKALGLTAKTAKGTVRGVVDIGKAVVQIPISALRAALNGSRRG